MHSLGSSTIEQLGPPATSTITFYAADSAGGTPDILNTVTIVNGHVTAWVQVHAGAGAGTGEGMGLLLALTQA